MPIPPTAPLENDWRAMTDVHQFFGLLKNISFPASRLSVWSATTSPAALIAMRCRAAGDGAPGGNEIMIFVGNRGCVQIFTGALEKVAPMRGWLNIFNPPLPCICARRASMKSG
jgi:putative hemin transport protein